MYLHITDEEAVEGISGRLQCEQDEKHIYHRKYNPPQVEDVCDIDGGKLFTRSDDQPDAVRKRIAAFHEKTRPLLDYYREQGLLIEIDAEKAIDDVTQDVLNALQGLRS